MVHHGDTEETEKKAMSNKSSWFLYTFVFLFVSSVSPWCNSSFAAAPVLSSIMPRGGQRGTEVVLTFGGTRLADAQEVMCYSPGFQVAKLDTKDNQVQATIKIAA